MNRPFLLYFSLGLAILLPVLGHSTHIVGGEISYNCLGNDQYRITMAVYRDCFTGGAPFDSPARLTVFGGDDLISPFNTFDVFPIIESIPPEVDNPCLEPPPNICVEQGLYGITLTLPFNPDGYYLSYERCCRNPTIDNIQAPNTVGATYSIFISELAQTSCNDSPVFNDFPPIVICNQQELNFDHSATDNEGDSLVYYFCAPFVGASQTTPAPNEASPPPYSEVNFIDPPFSPQFPMGGNPLVTIDSTTGLITGIPQVQGQFVVGVCVEEYRNDTLLSTTQRDFQFNVTNCTQLIDADIQEDVLIGPDQYVVNSCGDSVVTFINESQDVNFIDSYEWTFDLNGTIVESSLANPTITFPDTGLYFATLILNNGNEDCTDSADIWINIFPPIEADYSFVYDTCSPGPIQFTDLSTTGASAITDWDWSFGDGNFSDDQNPFNQFDNPAIYEMALTVTDVNGCEDFITQSLEWFPSPDISFTTNTDNGCEPLTVNFQNTSIPFNNDYTLDWEFGDGTMVSGFNPTHTYDMAGVYTVIMHASSPSGCMVSDTFPDFITVYELPVASFTYQYDSCEIEPVFFFDNTSFVDGNITEWLWEFGDDSTSLDQNPSHLYADAGSYDVTLTITDEFGCVHSVTQNVDWFPAPIIDINPNIINGCAPLTVEFENNSYPITGYTTIWDLGDGSTSNAASPIHLYENPGIYTVSVTITSPTNCVETDTFFNLIQVDTLPTANFTFVYDSCAIEAVSFFDQSIAGSGVIAQWEWDFGDDSLSMEQNPEHLYADAGSYDVTLITTNSNGCKDTISHTVDWFPAPVIDIVPTDIRGCAPFLVEFENNSYPINGYTTIWDLGDGSTSNAASPIHLYEDPGIYTVSVTITSPTNCVETDTFFNLITVDTLPTANFTFVYDSCAIEAVNFFDQSIPGSGMLSQWEWDFGDDSTSQEQNPSHLYADAGSYDVTLITTNSNGCKDTISHTVDWFPAPIIDVTPNVFRGCEPLEVTFENNSYPINGYSTFWTLGDGTTDTSASPTHIYPEPGEYTVTLMITSPTGCIETDTFANLIVVDTLPTANFEMIYDTCAIAPINFNDLSIAGSGELDTWTWDFGDGNFSNDQSPVYEYDEPGDYEIKLVVTNEFGCIDSTTQNLSWWPSTIINIGSTEPRGCTPHTVSFSNNSQPLNGYSIVWDFGDGNTDDSLEPTHTYSFAGTYTVSFSTFSPTGCIGTDTLHNYVIADSIPIADFIFTSNPDSCIIGPVTFSDQSILGSGAISSWDWDFGDGTFSDEQNPVHLFTGAGSFDVSLTIIDENGCTDSTSQTVLWAPSTIIDVTPDDPHGCTPHTVFFENNSFPINGYDILWEFGDGSTDTTVSPTHTYLNEGVYDVTLTVVSPLGCLSDEVFTEFITVDTIPTADFTWNLDDCEDGFTNFVDLSIRNGGQITDWSWAFGDGNFSNEQNPSHAYAEQGTYLVDLTVTDENGCIDSIEQELTWWPPSRIEVEVDDYLGCIPHPVQFINNSDPVDGYDIVWDFGDGSTSTDLNPSHVYTEPGNYDVGITITTPTGCTTSDLFPNMVRVMDKPIANFSYSPDNPSNFDPEVQFTDESELVSQWEWDFGNGDFSLQQNPLYSYPDTGVYVVTLLVTQLGGCQDSISQVVDVEPLFTYFLPNAFTPNDDGVNDGFRGTGITYTLRDFEMTIWTRWGEMVFQTNDPEEAWNGRKDNTGRLSQLGVYVYNVNLTEGRGKRHEYKGFVTLVR